MNPRTPHESISFGDYTLIPVTMNIVLYKVVQNAHHKERKDTWTQKRYKR